MKEKLYQSLIELTNGNGSSRFLKAFSQSKVSKHFIRSYTKVYDINIEEVSKNINEFASLHDFFVRTLREDVRPVDMDARVFASPVDAKVEMFGTIEQNMTFRVKGKDYALTDLLGNAEAARRYRNGQYIVFYLSPADYHRMHSPVDGDVMRQYLLGQKSYPVNKLGLQYGKNPLSQNYRMVTELQYTPDRFTAFIKVGAMFVNSIELTNTTKTWHKGEEVGYFSFGSTVVMLFEQDAVKFMPNITTQYAIRMGEPFATML